MQNKKLIVLLAVLLLLRFVFVPWFEWQDEQFGRLQTLDKRLERSEALLSLKEQVSTQAAQVNTASEQLLAGLVISATPAEYKIAFQQALQQQLDSVQVRLQLFEWNSDRALEAFNVQRGRINLRLQGAYPNLLRAHAQLELQFPGVQIRELRATWPGALSAAAEVELQLVIDLDYRIIKS